MWVSPLLLQVMASSGYQKQFNYWNGLIVKQRVKDWFAIQREELQCAKFGTRGTYPERERLGFRFLTVLYFAFNSYWPINTGSSESKNHRSFSLCFAITIVQTTKRENRAGSHSWPWSTQSWMVPKKNNFKMSYGAYLYSKHHAVWWEGRRCLSVSHQISALSSRPLAVRDVALVTA